MPSRLSLEATMRVYSARSADRGDVSDPVRVRDRFFVDLITGSYGLTRILSEHGDRLDWQTREYDYAVMDRITTLLASAKDVPDPVFVRDFLPGLLTLMQESFFFAALDDPSIRVSPAHTGTTPFVHTGNVIRELETGGLTSDERYYARWSAVFHDLGKLFIATADGQQHHAEISYEVMKDYLASRQDHEAIEYLPALRFHHALEHIETADQSQVKPDEVKDYLRSLVPTESARKVLAALVLADRKSIPSYKLFALQGVLTTLTYLVDTAEVRKEETLADYILSLTTGAVGLMRELENTVETIDDRLRSLYESIMSGCLLLIKEIEDLFGLSLHPRPVRE